MNKNNISQNKNQRWFFENRLNCIINNPVICLSLIGFVGAVIRFYYFPYDVPLTLDALSYFWYAIDISVLGQFPNNYNFPNNGWPSFLSIFFSLYNSEKA